MTARRIALAAAVLILPLLALCGPARGQKNVPSSIALVYLPKKIFKAGDWVLYKVEGENDRGQVSTDYQRVQIGLEQPYRGEDCFWLETGWGKRVEDLIWGAAMISENMFLDSLADVRGSLYMRLLHVSTQPDGTPLAVPVRTVDPKRSLDELLALRPVHTELGLDTLDTPKGPIVCRLVEVKRTYRTARDMADSTMQQGTLTTAKRWYNADLVPITGLVREEEEKIYTMRVWPLGKPSTNYPMREIGKDVTRVELLDFGHGAKPMVSDRIRLTRDASGGDIAD
jgi:hypothetical protein